MKYVLVPIVVMTLVLALVLGGGNVLDEISCQSKTADIGYAHRYTFLAGCQIEIEDGRWIPLDAYYYQERP